MTIDILQLILSNLSTIAELKKEPVKFLQIGAHDGLHYDPISPYIRKHHWEGILVEPQPEIFKRLVRNYEGQEGLVFENIAIGNETGEMRLYRFKEGQGLHDHSTMLCSFNKDFIVNNGHNYKHEIEEIKVPCLTLDDLLFKHNITYIDVLQIDTEGFDFEILKMVNNSVIHPTVIHFEHAFKGGDELNNYYKMLESMGYRTAVLGIDTVALLQEDKYKFCEYLGGIPR
jgi:FkbM family methyltransferase